MVPFILGVNGRRKNAIEEEEGRGKEAEAEAEAEVEAEAEAEADDGRRGWQ
jgi:hypothetical protein